mmetsp:Transcript_13851/g.20436  ORF Transcript_13851/g.20436 Transcript_13851/m.20436 type:complete len:263 (+) Transcript_13851:28-816(+)
MTTTLKSIIRSALPLLSISQSYTISPTAWAQIILAGVVSCRCYPTILSLQDILFVVLFPSYLLLANHYRFENNKPIRQRSKDHPHSVTNVTSKFFSASDAPWFMQRYMPMAATIGIVLPLLTVIFSPNKEVVNLTIPHLLVLWCQIIGESVTMFNPYAHRFITLLLPIGFSIYRTRQLILWSQASFSLVVASESSQHAIALWGLILSSINLVFWTYNLLVMLLLRVTPEFLSNDKCEAAPYAVSLPPFVQEPKNEKVESKNT